jgi:anti-sigma-K factor RskA
MTEDPEDDRDGLAAEYVIGTLEAAERAYVERLAARDPVMAGLIADWQDRLMPLILLAPPVPPPAGLWRRIERGLRPLPARPTIPLWDRIGFWRFAGGAGFAIAAVLAVFLLLRPSGEPLSVAALAPVAGGAPVFIAEASAGGGLRLMPISAVPVASDRDLELWALAPGATAVSLGVLPATGRRGLAVPAPRTQLLVSLEPKGGAPNGVPTGPVLFGGTLTTVD